MIVARRPTTRPSASIRCHFFSTSAGLIDLVVFISAFMGWTSSLKQESAAQGQRRGRANAGRGQKVKQKRAFARRVKYYRTLVFDPIAVSRRGSRSIGQTTIAGTVIAVQLGDAGDQRVGLVRASS